MKSNKTQMEIMGLAIIVILVAMAMLFVVQFIVLKEPTELKKTYTYSELAANTLNAMLKTTTACKDQDITRLLQDCAAYPPDGLIVCNGGSCDFVTGAIKEILNQTLVTWNIAFNFTTKIKILDKEENVIPPISQGTCIGERQTKIYPIPTAAGPMIVRLDICG